MSQGNPYTSPAAPGAPVGRSEPFTGQIDFMAMFRYVMTSPNWMLNVLLVTVCQLVPIAGPIVLLGYIFEALEVVVRDARRPYIDFDFGRLSNYFMRGLWPFLVTMVASLVIVPILMIFAVVFAIAPLALLSNAKGELAGVLFVFVMLFDVVLFTLLMLVLQTAVLPFVLAAALSQDFGTAMNISFARDFFGRTWKEALKVQVLFGLAAICLSLVGSCVFFVGAYLAGSFCAMAATHLYYQLYSHYLIRGGKPVPLKEEPLP